MTKFCVDCKHYRPAAFPRLATCAASDEKAAFYVTGEHEYEYCVNMRVGFDISLAKCGRDAVLFEPVEDATTASVVEPYAEERSLDAAERGREARALNDGFRRE